MNIFGGAIQGDIVAKGIIAAMKDLQISLPVVVRIQGASGAPGMDMVPPFPTIFVCGFQLVDCGSSAKQVLTM